MKKVLLPILNGVLLGVLCYILGAMFSGGGHNLNALVCLFPYGMTAVLLWEATSLEFIGTLLLVLQFPLYALVFVNVKDRERGRVVLPLLAFAHVAAAVVGLNVYSASKW